MRDLAHVLLLLADHNALHAALGLDAGVDQVVGLDAAQRTDPSKAFFIDGFNHQPQLIHMGGQNYPLSAAFFVRDQVAQAVDPHFIHMTADPLLDILRHFVFPAGGAVQFTKLLCQSAVKFHSNFPPQKIRGGKGGYPLPPSVSCTVTEYVRAISPGKQNSYPGAP